MSSTDKTLSVQDIPVTNFGEFMVSQMQKFGKSEAIVDGETGNAYTFEELIIRTKRVAAGLQGVGVQSRDVVCIMAPNHLEYIVAFYAVSLVNATFQPINPMYTKDDVTKVVKACNTKFMITLPSLVPKVKEALAEFPHVKIITLGGAEGCISFDSLADPSHGDYVAPQCDPKNDTAALMSSSGTTGFPKSVQLSHYAIVANMLQINCSSPAKEGDTFVLFLPMFHAYGLYILTADVHTVGCKIVLMPKFEPMKYLELIQQHKPSVLHTVPPVMVLLAKHPKVSDFDLSSVKSIVCGAAPLSKEIEEAVKTRLNLDFIFQGYGMTEVGVTHLNSETDNKYKSVGKKLPLVEMKIVNVDTEEEVGTNEEGEIWIRGPQLSNGYLNMPSETKEMFMADGWTRTGDIGVEDEDGFLYVVDRLKELIKYKGFQVAPATLEDIILMHDAVADVGVVGVPDEEAGELPRAYVVKKAGKEIKEQEIIEFVAERVAPHLKLRGGVEFTDVIPRTLSGKILRRALRERARELAKSKSN